MATDGGDGMVYSFPMKRPKDLVELLSYMNINTSEEVLRNPQQHVAQVSMIFEKLVETATGVTKEDMNQPAFAALSVLSYPDIHEDNIAFMALFRAVCKMMKISRIDDFSLKDMSEPKPKRLIRQLSAVVNFIRFREGKESMFREAMAKKRAIREKARTAQLRHSEVVEQLEDLQDKMAEKKEAIKEITVKTDAVKSETAELSRSAAAIREGCAELKKASFAAKDRVAAGQTALKQAEMEKERLQGQVVNSPQRILREVEDQQQALEQELADVEGEVNNTQRLQHSVAVMSRAKREMPNSTADRGSAATELSKQEFAFKEVKSTQRKIVDRRGECAARASEISEEQRKLVRFEEKLSHLRKQATFKTEATVGELDAVRTAIAETEMQWKEANGRLEEARAIMDQLKQEKENVKGQIAQQVAETKGLLDMVCEICRSHGQRLEAAMREGADPSSKVLA
ncbi:unnamed protein product [Ascophyllum nodosum]